MAITITIEKGVPIPPLSGRKGKGEWQIFLSGLEIGDSFLLPTEEAKASRNIPYAARGIGIKVTRRQMKDGSVRVWRVA